MCKVENCEELVHSRGWCQKHYRRFMNHGSTDEPIPLKRPGPKPGPPRPKKERPKKTHCPHGHEYSEENTSINPSGARVCKTCQRERMKTRRGPAKIGQGGVNAAKAYCPRQHEYTEANTMWSKDGRRQCRECARARSRLNNITKYGLTPDDFFGLLEEQDTRCLICQREFYEECGIPNIDHDHKCCAGEFSCGACVRGLLCGHCNRGLSQFRDSVEYLEAAVRYLSK